MLTLGHDAPMPDLVGAWPLVGREAPLEHVVDTLVAAPGGAVAVAGPAGVGKSRVVAQAVRHLEDRGLCVALVRASQSASSIPFGALAPLLPVDDLLADSLVGLLQRAERAIAARGDGRDVVLAVDDAHLLDDASGTLIHQLALAGNVRLLLAVRTGEQVGPSIAGVLSSSSITVVELHDLTRADVAKLARTALGGDVDAPLAHAVWEASRGNPLYVRELLVASLDDGSIVSSEGIWRLVDRLAVPGRLVELVETRVAAVDENGRRALELLAVAGSVGRQSLEDVVGTETISRLLQRGLVVAGRDGRRLPVRLHHPLYEDVIRARMSSRRLRARQQEMAEAIEATGLRRRPDRLFATTLRLDAGGRVDVDMLEAAALDAYFALDVTLTERLTRAGVAAGAGPRLRRILAEILRYQGRSDEAESALASAPVIGVDERERALTAIVRAENLFRGLGDHDGAFRVLDDTLEAVRDPEWRDELSAMRAVLTALSGDVRTALASAEPIIARGPSRAMTVASTAAVASMAFVGRCDDAADLAEQAFLVAGSLAPQESQAVVALHIVERCLGLVEGGRLAYADAVAQLSYDWSVAGGHQLGQGWFAMLLARSAQTGGRIDEARRRFREAALVFADQRDHGIRRWALTGVTQTAALLGRVSEAEAALDELDTAPRVAVHLLEAEVLRARGWLAIARGAVTEGRQRILDAAEWAAARGQHGHELTMLHDLVRLGDARAAERASTLAPTIQGRLASARGLHAAGLRTQDGDVLDEASASFADLAANLFAAEAAAQAAGAHRRSGRAASADASAARAAELAARCDGVSTPALASMSSTAVDRLTPRELEIASLAARGSTSREIAAQLSISVRTVDNLLQRAYTKLGVTARHQLADHLPPA
jgi:DNA-binding CsgD family transcriptional regulator